MWRIIDFLSRSGNLILFLLLELIAFVLVVTLNPRQASAFQGFSHEIGGGFSEIHHSITAYFNLGRTNSALQEENALLNEELIRLRQEVNAYRYRFPYSRAYIFPTDTLLPVNAFDFIPGRVVNNSIDRNYNYLTLNKGRKHGVYKNMGVISPKGIAGIVISVSENYSLALSMLNKNFHLSARVRRNQNIGTLSWEGNNPDEGILENIPQTSPLTLGDTVLTSGYSSIFPEDFMVGIVTKIDEQNHTGFYNIQVEFATDFRSLDQVYLLNNLHRTEIDTLEMKAPR